jgi:fermentation-respiration switch protein FrsA (DUF1100 family)
MRHPMIILAVIAGAYLAVCVLAFVFQRYMVFFPDRAMFGTPASVGLPYEDVFFDTSDGVRLHGWFVPAPKIEGDAEPRVEPVAEAAASAGASPVAAPGSRRVSSNTGRVVLFFHGNAGNLTHRVESIRIFHELGLSVFIFDYRGYGRSEGRVSERGTYVDARAAYRYLAGQKRIDPGSIIFFGRSLGGAVAVELATEHRPLAMILESCFPSLADVGQRAYRFLPVRWLLRIRYDSTQRIASLDCPKLIVHSRQDEIVPLDLGRQLFDAAIEPKTWMEIAGDHNSGFVVSGAAYTDGLKKFLQTLD